MAPASLLVTNISFTAQRGSCPDNQSWTSVQEVGELARHRSCWGGVWGCKGRGRNYRPREGGRLLNAALTLVGVLLTMTAPGPSKAKSKFQESRGSPTAASHAVPPALVLSAFLDLDAPPDKAVTG